MMGLDTSHGAWHGAYGAFSRWRNEVAKAAGFPVEPDSNGRENYVLNWDAFVPENYQGEWDRTPHDALLVLLAHSDCDGVIHPEQAGPLADRLEGLLPLLDGEGGGHLARMGGNRGATEQFIKGLRAAVAAGEDLDFH